MAVAEDSIIIRFIEVNVIDDDYIELNLPGREPVNLKPDQAEWLAEKLSQAVEKIELVEKVEFQAKVDAGYFDWVDTDEPTA